MKKYYCNDNNYVWSNDERASNARQVTACYSAEYLAPGHETNYSYSYANHSPWFCLKDGQYPIYEPYGGRFVGFRRICDFTISSISSQYFLYGNPSDGQIYKNYKVPFFMPYVEKMDMYVDSDNVFDTFNPNSGNKLLWKVKKDVYMNYNTYDVGNLSWGYWDESSGFLMNPAMQVETAAVCKNLTAAIAEESNTATKWVFNNQMHFPNVPPTLEFNNNVSGTYYRNNGNTSDAPPHYTIDLSNFSPNITGVKVKAEGIFVYSTLSYNAYPILDDKLVNNINGFNNGEKSTNCLAFFYKIDNNNSWEWKTPVGTRPSDVLNEDFSGTIEYVPGSTATNYFVNKSGVTTSCVTYRLNALEEPEKQDFNNEELRAKIWNNVFVYSSNSADAGTNKFYYLECKEGRTFNNGKTTGYGYLDNTGSEYTSRYNVILQVQPPQYNLHYASFLKDQPTMPDLIDVSDKPDVKTNSAVHVSTGPNVPNSANNRFIIHFGDDGSDRYYLNNTFAYMNPSDAALTSITPAYSLYDYSTSTANEHGFGSELSSNWKIYGNAPMRIPCSATNHQVSDVTVEYTIPISPEDRNKKLHLSVPATTVFLDNDIGLYGQAIELIMSYEGVE